MNSLPRGSRYRFSRFVLDAKERCLMDGEREVHLRPKTLDTLIYLVERRGHLISKNELLDAIWTDTEVTENALAQCIRELREALGDSQKDPRFIQTVQRAGYRFMPEVEMTTAGEEREYEEELSAVSVLIAEDDNQGKGRTATSAQLRKRRVYAAVALIALVGIALSGYWFFHRKPTLAFAGRDWILIADFDNFTGEKVFDAALRTALERELSLSSYVNLVPPGRIVDTLRLMRRQPDTRVTEETGREICLRDGEIRALLCGSIQQIGGTYTIALKLIDPADGVTLAVFDSQAQNRREVLPAMRRLSGELRQRLGEPLSSISKSTRPLEQVTTPSLEALAFYSKGVALMDQFEWRQAETFFDQAVALDPEFASGYFFRGLSRYMRSEDCLADYKRAAGLAGNASLRERLLIHGAVAGLYPGGLTESIDLYGSLLQQYPDDYWGHELLSWSYFLAGNLPRWSEHQAACRRLRPGFHQPHFHAGWVYLLFAGDYEKAEAEYTRLLELKPDFPSVSAQGFRAWVHWMRGEMEQAAAEFRNLRTVKFAHLPVGTQVAAKPYLARFYLFQGRPDAALEALETNRDLTLPMDNSALVRRFRFGRALIYQAMGNEKEFERLLNEEAVERVGILRVEALGWLAVSKARRGMKEQARSLQAELEKEERHPRVDMWHPLLPEQLALAKQAFKHQVEGEILLSEKETDSAIQHFEAVLKMVPPRNALFNTMLSPRVYLAAAASMAKAHERRGAWNAAVSAYETILRHKELCMGTDGAPTIWVGALKSISTALEAAGRSEEALKYQDEYRRLRPN